MTEKVELTPELLRELQLKQLDMLVYFRDFCEKNNLTFYLIGGALIGALRNGGFVPWDDDVDVMLPREDYEKLYKLWHEQGADGRFRLLKTDSDMFTGNIFMTVTDTNYTMVKTNQTEVDIPHGLVLDVFPLDVCPDSRFARNMCGQCFIRCFWLRLFPKSTAELWEQAVRLCFQFSEEKSSEKRFGELPKSI